MDLRNLVKHVLRDCGHAIVETIHDRLNGVDSKLNSLEGQCADIAESQARLNSSIHTFHDRLHGVESHLNDLVGQTASVVESQTALLQSTIYTIETLKEARADLRQQNEESRQLAKRLVQQSAAMAERQAALLDGWAEFVKEVKEGQGSIQRQSDGLSRRVDNVLQLIAGSEDSQTALLQSSIHLVETLRRSHTEIGRQMDAVLLQTVTAGRSQAELVQACVARMDLLAEGQESIRQDLRVQMEQGAGAGILLQQMKVQLEDSVRSGQAHSGLTQTGLQLLEVMKQDHEALRQHSDAFQQNFHRLLEQHDRMLDGARQTMEQILGLKNYTKTVFDQELVRQVCVETADIASVSPEIGLLEYLYSYLPTPIAIDIGAHFGEISERLLHTGYEVHAFEPYPPSYKKLVRRNGRHPKFHPHNFAVGCNEGEMPLHVAKDLSDDKAYEDSTLYSSLTAHSMPDDLPFTNTVLVEVKNLAKLHQAAVLPSDVSLVKIDTEGYDLEVIRGMEDHRYPVVVAEFWDREIPFGKSGLLYSLESLAEEMKNRGYLWYIVIYRLWGLNQRAYYCNHSYSVPGSWGNIVFFQNYDLFARAQTWCSATLPRTYFKPAPAAQAVLTR